MKIRDIVKTLRDPQKGCPWSQQARMIDIAPYTIEEAYEVRDALLRDDMDELKKELGDILFQITFLSQIAEEKGLFTLNDVDAAISAKMTRRHPHVFEEGAPKLDTPEQVHIQWEAIKRAEKDKARNDGHMDDPSLLADISENLPAMLRTQKLKDRARYAGFDWGHLADVRAKVTEELDELDAEIQADNKDAIAEEYGDALFVMLNLGVALNLNAEDILNRANKKFETRFRLMEDMLRADGLDIMTATQDQQTAYWQRAKKAIKNNKQAA